MVHSLVHEMEQRLEQLVLEKQRKLDLEHERLRLAKAKGGRKSARRRTVASH